VDFGSWRAGYGQEFVARVRDLFRAARTKNLNGRDGDDAIRAGAAVAVAWKISAEGLVVLGPEEVLAIVRGDWRNADED
jgi:hypothetical protein